MLKLIEKDGEIGFGLNENYTEILRLGEMLQRAGIPHTMRRLYDGWQILYPSEENRVSDAIQHGGSYGEAENLIEIMGLSDQKNNVEGYLSAEEVYERYLNHYINGGKRK